MKPTLAELSTALAVAVHVFEHDPHARALPFHHSFPKNSCERAAALLAVVLARKYPDSDVVLVKGKSPSNDAMHFWVEVDEFVVDPTAHQFEAFPAPFVRERPSPLESEFPRDEEHRDPQQSTDLPSNSLGQWDSALDALAAALNT